jgi:hypothetical protein
MTKHDKKTLVSNDLNKAKQTFIKDANLFITFDTLSTIGKKMIWDIEDRFTTKPEMEVAEKNALDAMIELGLI